MGVCEEAPKVTGMHWQQHDRYSVGPAYDPSRDLSPNLPVHSSDSCSGGSMGEAGDGSTSSSNSSASSSTSATSSCSSTSASCSAAAAAAAADCSNNNSCMQSSASCCRVPPSSSSSAGYKLPPSTPVSHQPPPPLSPGAHPPPPSCKLEEEVRCFGCGSKIIDRFYLQAVERKWHAACLQCCQCRQPLDGEVTCFARDGNIYCKKDYYRLFGMKRCARCQAAILASELVMRARDLVFHVHCFTCSVCNAPLTKGDHFGMHGHNVLCQHHFEVHQQHLAASSSSSVPGPPPPLSPGCPPQQPGYHPYHTPPFPSPCGDFHHPSVSPGCMQAPPSHPSPCGVSTGELHASKVQPFFNGAPAARQKGRPRKRKPKDLESLTANLDLNSDSYLDSVSGYGRAGPSPGLPGSNSQSQRTKRMRTSFKHHQLRTMKSYFAINHNPDAKDLKQLSQKTGLPKRVLQVWFQNARAKWRRMMIKQEGKLPPGEKPGSPCGPDLSHLGHAEWSAPGLHEAPCSPHYLLASPPPLDCSSS